MCFSNGKLGLQKDDAEGIPEVAHRRDTGGRRD